MSGKVTTHAAITYGRVNVRARVPKGAFIWPGLFYIKKKRYKIQYSSCMFFFFEYILSCCPLLAIWLLPRDSHYGQWPRSGEIDLMETKGMDTVLAYVLSVVFNRKGVHYLYKFEMF